MELQTFNQRGYAVVSGVLDAPTVSRIIAALETAQGVGVRRKSEIFAIRDLFTAVPPVCRLARSTALINLASRVLGAPCFAVRGLLFDKTPQANWKVPFHQDLTIAVREKKEATGFSAWSEKAGIIHVQPPLEVLENMVTLRIHLDDCDSNNGALRVLPGSHRAGRYSAQHIETLRKQVPEEACEVGAGGVLVMRPLLLHASSPATNPQRRRVLHIEYASHDLPDGLQWHTHI